MGNTLSKLFVIIMAVLLLFINPVLHMFEEQDKTTRLFVTEQTAQLVDTVRNTGYLSDEMYKAYLNKLNATNNLYKVSLEHKHRRYDPVYVDPLDPATFSNEVNMNYDSYYTDDILKVLFPDSGTGSNYIFSEGDYFMVSISNRNKTLATKLKELIYGRTLPTATIFVQYGGMVK